MSLRLRRPAPLTKEHQKGDFDSGDHSKDEWLRRHAGQGRPLDTAATWVIADQAMAVVGYVALAMTAVDASAAPESLRRQAPRAVPALLIGRLAVDRRAQGRGVGTALVAHVLATAVELREKAAFRAVLVDSADPADPAAVSWWKRFGFEPLTPGSTKLFLASQDIARTLETLS
ncbi:MAG: GNAT family N-acetyltransferase [Bifidobacteriaceae bacterium]|nr:GNAT family N-acetyltransferase [Bifidobacteriaceae bacterium]